MSTLDEKTANETTVDDEKSTVDSEDVVVDETVAVEEESTADGEPTDRKRKQRRRFVPKLSRAGTLVVLLVLVLALAAAVTFGVLLFRKAGVERAGNEALATARSYAVTATSYNYQNLDRDFGAVLDGATGQFKAEYSSATDPLRQLLVQSKATATSTVVGAGIQSESTAEVVVVVLVNQSVTNVNTPQPTLAPHRLIMTLTPADSRWLVSKLDLI